MKQRTNWQNSVSEWSEERLGVYLLTTLTATNHDMIKWSSSFRQSRPSQWWPWWAWWWPWWTWWPRWPWSNGPHPSGSPAPPSDGLLARGWIRFGQWVKALIWPWAFYGQTGDIVKKKFWQWCCGRLSETGFRSNEKIPDSGVPRIFYFPEICKTRNAHLYTS